MSGLVVIWHWRTNITICSGGGPLPVVKKALWQIYSTAVGVKIVNAVART